ncbi:MAG: VWA domain-containing protein [Planctomycetes bacterium]|nr:VWA domain-containing protein [Planctomycetota bacterium]MCP4771240.1 VWA domain-containing protein [Planctomycetota bacterium]MCP4862033.1 VWA domain-containing protein [Planctomycetota bacterium]
MLTALILSLLPCAQLDAISDTLHAATDKSSYEKGAYNAAKELAEMRSAEAMELRLELFDDKMDTYRGVYLRDWFFSGFLKASTAEEADLMADAAADKKRSEWQRVVLLRALGRCSATVSGKLMLDKSFDKAPVAVRREWGATLGILLHEKRLDLSKVKPGKLDSAEAVVRARLATPKGNPWPGLAYVPELSSAEIELLTALIRVAKKAEQVGDSAIALRTLAGHKEGWNGFTAAASSVFQREFNSAKAVYIDAAVKNKVVSAVPALIQALETESVKQPNRFSGDIGAALRSLTGQGFGDDAKIWNQWYSAEGAAWLEKALSGDSNAKASERVERDTVARFFGLAIDSSNVVFLVDGSGSMSTNQLGDLSCADAAAKEVEGFITGLPKGVMFQVVVVEQEPVFAFKKMMPANKGNAAKALKFLNSRPFKSTSALYDALEQVQQDPMVDTIVVISDGGSSAGKHQYNGHILDGASRLFERSGVRIHTVLVTDSTKHEKFMKELASLTGGRMAVPKN